MGLAAGESVAAHEVFADEEGIEAGGEEAVDVGLGAHSALRHPDHPLGQGCYHALGNGYVGVEIGKTAVVDPYHIG